MREHTQPGSEAARRSRDRLLATLTSFLAYFTMSAVITPLGLTTKPMAEQFSVEVTATTAVFSYLTSGLLIGSFLAMFVVERLGVRTLNVLAGVTLLVGLAGIANVSRFVWLAPPLVTVGTCCGLLLAAGAIVITELYSERLRAPVFLVTDSFYSGAGVIAGYLAGALIGRGHHWSATYGLAAGVTAVLVVLALITRYPEATRGERHDGARESLLDWPPSVYCVFAALLLYILSFVAIYSWIPNYAAESLLATPEQGGALVGRFFLGLFVGQLVMFFLVLRGRLGRWVAATSILAAVTTVGLWTSATHERLSLFMLALGLVSGGLLKTLLTYGTLVTPRPSARLVGFLVFSTAIGSSLGPWVSSTVVDLWGTRAALVGTTVGYSAMAILVVVTVVREAENRSYGVPEAAR